MNKVAVRGMSPPGTQEPFHRFRPSHIYTYTCSTRALGWKVLERNYFCSLFHAFCLCFRHLGTDLLGGADPDLLPARVFQAGASATGIFGTVGTAIGPGLHCSKPVVCRLQTLGRAYANRPVGAPGDDCSGTVSGAQGPARRGQRRRHETLGLHHSPPAPVLAFWVWTLGPQPS